MNSNYLSTKALRKKCTSFQGVTCQYTNKVAVAFKENAIIANIIERIQKENVMEIESNLPRSVGGTMDKNEGKMTPFIKLLLVEQEIFCQVDKSFRD